MSEVKVSVIIPVYNGAKVISQAIDSALNQDVPLEVIVIDDCSSDDIDDVMASYKNDPRVRFEKNESNSGVAKTRNRGVAMSGAEYVAFLDADDIWREGKLKKQIAAMEAQNAVLSSTGRELMDASGKTTGRVIPIIERIEYKDILKHNMLSTSAVVVKREVMQKYPMEHDDSHEDYITWMKIIKEYGFAIGIDEPFLMYRLSEGSKSGNKFKSARMTYKAYRYAGLGIYSSLIHFITYAFNGVKKYYG
ncbi:MAG: glycosyltransferase family 2 protein [Eubacterium sp.]|nr:glycosyltransferase family 2 protein [Eubacterium sp.]